MDQTRKEGVELGSSPLDGKGQTLLQSLLPQVLLPWEQLHSHGATCTAQGLVPTAGSPLRPQIFPEHQGCGRGPHLRGRQRTPAAAPPAWPCLHPTAPFSTDRYSSHRAPSWNLPGGKQVPHGLSPVSSRGAARSAGSTSRKQQLRGHCATGASLAAGMCPQGLQVLPGHWAVPWSRDCSQGTAGEGSPLQHTWCQWL